MSRIPDTGTDALLSVVAGGGAVTGFLSAAATGCSWVMVVINVSFRGRRWPEFGHVKMSSWRGAEMRIPRGRMISAGEGVLAPPGPQIRLVGGCFGRGAPRRTRR